MGKIVDYSPVTGIRETYAFNIDGKHLIEYHQDCQHIVDYAASFRNERFSGDGGDIRPVAEIPHTVWMEWCRLEGVPLSDWARVDECINRRIAMNDPEYARLRMVAKLASPNIIVKGVR